MTDDDYAFAEMQEAFEMDIAEIREERDEALAQRDEAVALLRRFDTWFCEGRVGLYCNIHSDARAFLSRLDSKGDT